MLGFAPRPEDLRFWDCVDKGTLFIFSCFQEHTHINQAFSIHGIVFGISLCWSTEHIPWRSLLLTVRQEFVVLWGEVGQRNSRSSVRQKDSWWQTVGTEHCLGVTFLSIFWWVAPLSLESTKHLWFQRLHICGEEEGQHKCGKPGSFPGDCRVTRGTRNHCPKEQKGKVENKR